MSPKKPISTAAIFLSRAVETVRFFLAGYTLQRIKSSRSQTSGGPGEEKQKTLQTGEKRLAAELLASQTRLERATPGLGGSCSIQLSYWDIYQKYSIFPPKRIRTNCRLGGGPSIPVRYGGIYRKYSILQGSGVRTDRLLGGARSILLSYWRILQLVHRLLSDNIVLAHSFSIVAYRRKTVNGKAAWSLFKLSVDGKKSGGFTK